MRLICCLRFSNGTKTVDEIKNFLQNKRNLVSTLVLLVMLLVLPLGVYLAKVQQIFFSQAEGTYIQLGDDGNCVTTNALGEKALKCGTTPLVLFNPFLEQEPVHTQVDNGVIAYFPFDDNSSTDSAEFMTGRKANTAATRVVDGKFGKARKMEVGTVITYKDSAALDSDHQTVAAWVNPAQGAFKKDHFPSVIARRNNNNHGITLEFTGYENQKDGEMQCQMTVRDNMWRFFSYTVNSGTNKALTNQWNFVACSYDGTQLSLYMNGAITRTPVPLPQGGEAFAKLAKFKDTERGFQQLVMGRNTFGGEALNGIIDEATIWNRALSDDELNLLRSGTKVNPIQPDLKQDLISYWSFNNDSANSAIDVIGGKHGAVTGTSLVDFRGGKARKFDTQGQEIQVPDSFDFQKDKVSVSAWVKPASAQSFGSALFPSIFNKRPAANNGMTFEQAGYSEGNRNAGQMQLQWNMTKPDNLPGSASLLSTYDKIIPGVWNHIAAVYDGNQIRMYINGILSDFGTVPGKMLHPQGSVIKIGRNIINNQTFVGEIDDVAYWGRGLSGLEVAQLAMNRRPNGEPIETIITPEPEYHAPVPPPTAPPTPPPATPTPAPANPCSPRPDIIRSATMTAGGQRVVITRATATNPIQKIRFTGLTNARISGNTAPFEMLLGATETSKEFLIEQVTPNQAVNVSVVVTDNCGDYPLFFGGGADAGWPAPLVACNPAPNVERSATRIPGGMRVVRTAGVGATNNTPNNNLQSFELTSFDNVRVDYNGRTYKQGTTIDLRNGNPTGPKTITFDIYLIDNNRGGTFFFALTDSCRRITDFQGGGTRAAFGDGAPPAELPAPGAIINE